MENSIHLAVGTETTLVRMIKASISKELLQQKRQWCDRWKLTHQLPNLSKPISSPMHVQHHKTLKASFTSCISITPRKQEWQE
jgi:hypothetical protein